MGDQKTKKIKAEVLEEIRAAFQAKHETGGQLLNNIKERKNDIESLLSNLSRAEPDFVYRFYHQSFKVFYTIELIKLAYDLFKQLSPNSALLNSWFSDIVEQAIEKKFDDAKTNQYWLAETRPILEAFWHSKYFLEQMIASANELESAPEMLPSGWAAVLYLYDLR